MSEIDKYLEGRHNRGVLRLPLTGGLTADALSQMLAFVHDAYGSALWLRRAAEWSGPQPYRDYYDPEEQEELYVLRMEIGGPDFVDLLGQVQHLVPVLGAIAGALGIATTVLTMIKGVQEIRLNRLEYESGPLEHQIQGEELRRLLEKAEANPDRKHSERVYIQDVDTDLLGRAEQLAQEGKISAQALEQQARLAEIAAFRSEYILPQNIGKPALILLED